MLYQVFDDRAKKVQEHQAEKEHEKRQREEDAQDVTRSVREYEEELEKKRLEDIEKGKRQQEFLLQEIAAKEERKRELLQQLQREEANEEITRLEYDRKIQMRKLQGKQELDDFKRTNRLF